MSLIFIKYHYMTVQSTIELYAVPKMLNDPLWYSIHFHPIPTIQPFHPFVDTENGVAAPRCVRRSS